MLTTFADTRFLPSVGKQKYAKIFPARTGTVRKEACKSLSLLKFKCAGRGPGRGVPIFRMGPSVLTYPHNTSPYYLSRIITVTCKSFHIHFQVPFVWPLSETYPWSNWAYRTLWKKETVLLKKYFIFVDVQETDFLKGRKSQSRKEIHLWWYPYTSGFVQPITLLSCLKWRQKSSKLSLMFQGQETTWLIKDLLPNWLWMNIGNVSLHFWTWSQRLTRQECTNCTQCCSHDCHLMLPSNRREHMSSL